MSAASGNDQPVKPFWDTVFGRILIGAVTGLVVANVVKK